MSLFSGFSRERLEAKLQECNRIASELKPDESGFQTERDEEEFSSALAHGIGILQEKSNRGLATPEQTSALKAFLEKYGM